MTSYTVLSYSNAMQAVILAAGRGKRMMPLTEHTPKPLLKIENRPLLDYTFDALPDEVTDVILVVGYLAEKIKAYCGEEYRGKKIYYVLQERLEGTGKAVWEAKPFLNGRFLVLMADDIYTKEDIKKCLTHDRAMLVMKSVLREPGGRVILDLRGKLVDVIEEKSIEPGAFVGTNVFVLDTHFFEYEPVKLIDREGEWGLPQTVVVMSKDHLVSIVEAKKWKKVTMPSDLQLQL
ncbi:MAG: hypothetical protein COV91_03955 [Candidatus Taylorbacteria bacterium CG11_big_fil_rev_8_21_14_0_20_46_11]|uniref:Nucleotidyl transferase domain-containing protein n=1 Tax=Candidatus Taylorbacteria bacterium CG11_big_fil_rev_8_21_14_0_20_46_11 TaxID=1975025 RepID=A0A2H0KB33_9BACT|nr:MAG: hypothetical protein COV91_03955 [Candidatus Taylorbacteria bacterium CG11_big_fil_rev_8_21_14_0_20_46_11]